MTDQIIPVLFKVLFGFILLNMIINLYLLKIKRKRIYKLLCIFWPSVLVTFILQSLFQVNPFHIALAYSATFLPMTVFSMIGFEALNRKFPIKAYIIYYLSSLGLTICIYELGFGFTAYSMPLAIATGTPLAHTFIYMNVVDRKLTTHLQKFLGILYLLLPIHCINFAIFRLDNENQIWGWLVAYALYDILAILLPSMALEMANLTENVRLNGLIKERTAELELAYKENNGLLKILLHDLTGPLMVSKMYLKKYNEDQALYQDLLGKIEGSIGSAENILLQTRERYQLKTTKQMTLQPVRLEDCFQDVVSIFTESLTRKNVTLKLKNTLPPDTYVLADKVSLTHNVLSNLVSNALKFSMPNTSITISALLKNGEVILEVTDQGPGIGKEILDRLKNGDELTSTPGSLGETGSGFGLSIVQSMVRNYGGQIDFGTSKNRNDPNSFGTNVRITLNSAQTITPSNSLIQ